MPASKPRLIMAALVTALRTRCTGTGDYTYDLTGSDRVKVGRPGLGHARPLSVWLAVGAVDTGEAPQLGRWRRQIVIDVVGFVPAISPDPEDTTYAACDLLQDIVQAVQADRSLGGLVTDLSMEGVALDGDDAGMPGMALVIGQISAYWLADSGSL